jgi:hypothetical protein
MDTEKNTSEAAFEKALIAENKGNDDMAQRWLDVAVKRDMAERNLS